MFRDWASKTFAACPLANAENYRSAWNQLDESSRRRLPERHSAETLFTYVCRLNNHNKSALQEIGKMAHLYPSLEQEIRESEFSLLFYDFKYWAATAFRPGTPLADRDVFRITLSILDAQESANLLERTQETCAEYICRLYDYNVLSLKEIGTAIKYSRFVDWRDSIKASPFGSLFFD